MSKRILLIDSDEAFAQGLSSAMNARGFAATMATNSEQGMTLAKSESPDLIVVCVEAQPTNGYMLCTRLKKDEQLKGIPVILTSANATPDSFEKHKKLKTRAEEYLIKPFEPQVMLEKASMLLGVALPPEAPQEEQIVQVEDEPLGLGDLVHGEDEPISLSEADAQAAHAGTPEDALEVEEVEEVVVSEEAPAAHEEDDLQMFDKAFDSLGGPREQDDQKAFGGLHLAPEPETAAEPVAEEASQPTELSAPDDDAVLSGLMAEGEAPTPSAEALPEAPALDEHLAQAAPSVDAEQLAAAEARVAELEQQLAERTAELEQAKKGSTSGADVLKLKEAKTRADKEVLKLKEEFNAKEKELLELQEQQHALETQAQTLKDDALKREAAAKALQQRADALAAAAKKFERELTTAREEAKQVAGLKARVAELEKLSGAHDELKKKHEEASAEAGKHKERAAALETELAGVREMHSEELETARGEAETHKTAHAAAQDELGKARAELEAGKGELETTRHELEGLRAELETVRTDVTALTGEKDLLAEERDELKKQLEESQVTAVQNEDRAVKAYQKIKNDEKLREKTRKALQIALQLLDENATDEEASSDQAEKKSA